MDTNTQNQNQQTNTFTGGMDMDTSDMYIKSNKYRYAENLRLTTIHGDSGELQLIDGVRKITLYTKKGDVLSGTILSIDSIHGICALVVKEGDSDTWSVYTFDESDTDDYKVTINRVAGPYDTKIWDDGDIKNNTLLRKPISTVIHAETENNIKLYIADGKHTVKVILVKGDNIEKNNSSLDSAVLPPPDIRYSDENSGVFSSPVLQYAYVLYTEAGYRSQISSLSKKIYLYKTNIRGYLPNDSVNGKVYLTFNPEINSNDQIKIRIYRIEYSSVGELLKCYLIRDAKYMPNFIDTGTFISEVDPEKVEDLYYHEIIPKYIERKGDYLFGAGIKDATAIVNETFKNFDARCYSNGNFIINSNNQKVYFKDLNWVFPDIDDYDVYHNEFSTLINGKYEHNNQYLKYNKDNWITNHPGWNGWGPYLRWKYVYQSIVRDLQNPAYYGESSNSNEYNEESFRTYRRGDVYRFGIILYDKDGNQSSVKWIADIKMPPAQEDSSNHNIRSSIGYFSCVKDKNWHNLFAQDSIGIQFSPTDPTDAIWKNISAYEIVQAVRTNQDKYTLQQGLSGFALTMDGTPTKCLHPAFLTQCGMRFCAEWWGSVDDYDVGQCRIELPKTDNTYKWVCADTDKSVMLFASPEYCFNPEDTVKLLNNYSSLVLETSNAYSCQFAKEDSRLNYWTNQMPSKRWYDDHYWGVLCGPSLGENSNFADFHSSFYINNPKSIVERYGEYCGISTDESTKDKYYVFDPGIYDVNIFLPMYNLHEDIDNRTEFYFKPGDKDSSQCLYSIENNAFGDIADLYLWISPLSCIKFAHVTPECKLDVSSDEKFVNLLIGISSICKTVDYTVPAGLLWGEGGVSAYYADDGSVNGKTFVNWHAPGLFKVDSWLDLANTGVASTNSRGRLCHSITLKNWASSATEYVSSGSYGDLIYNETPFSVMFNGRGGRALLLGTKDSNNIVLSDVPDNGYPPIFVSNIINTSATPYGGCAKAHILQTKYKLTGAFAKTSDFARGIYDTKCFCGDCFINPFTYCATYLGAPSDLKENADRSAPIYFGRGQNVPWDYIAKPWHMLTVIYSVPIESDVNLRGQTSGVFEDANGNFDTPAWAQLEGGRIWWDYNLNDDGDMYMYNSAYHADNIIFQKSPDDTEGTEPETYLVRMYHSKPKHNGEYVERWVEFDSSDTMDVDSRYGYITGLKLFKDKLMFWQDHAVGIVSSNTRTMVKDDENNNILLGNGDVFERFDYVSTLYGTKPKQNTIAVTDDSVYWWDGYQKEMLKYAEGYSVTPLSTTNGVKSFVSRKEESELPSVSYDKKYKEVLFSVFKDEDTLVYNEYAQQFISIYKYSPVFYSCLDYIDVVTSKNGSLYINNRDNKGKSEGFDGNILTPSVKFVVNNNPAVLKVFDTLKFNGTFYDDYKEDGKFHPGRSSDMEPIIFEYTTKGQFGTKNASESIDEEYDYKISIPRALDGNGQEVEYGNRLRGKTMQCEIKSVSNDLEFTLQYITTKYRISWT